jgi:hypothetical protein
LLALLKDDFYYIIRLFTIHIACHLNSTWSCIKMQPSIQITGSQIWNQYMHLSWYCNQHVWNQHLEHCPETTFRTWPSTSAVKITLNSTN